MKNFVKKLKRWLYPALQMYKIVPGDRRRYIKQSQKVNLTRLYFLIEKLDGCIVECGVAEGEGLSFLKILSLAEGKNRQIYGFDTFRGLPEGEFKGDFSHSIDDVKQFFGDTHTPMDGIELIKGDIRQTLKSYALPAIAFLHIDVDLYEGHNAALELLWGKIVLGGIVIFDDYGSSKWSGAAKAVDEFVSKRNLVLHQTLFAQKYYLIKV